MYICIFNSRNRLKTYSKYQKNLKNLKIKHMSKMTTYTELLTTRNESEVDLSQAYKYDLIMENIEKANLATIRATVMTVLCLKAQNYNVTKSYLNNSTSKITVPSSIYEYKSFSIRMGVLIATCNDKTTIAGISQLMAYNANNVQMVVGIVKLINMDNDTITQLVRRHSTCKISMTLTAQQAYMTCYEDIDAMLWGLGFPGPHQQQYLRNDQNSIYHYIDDGHVYGPDCSFSDDGQETDQSCPLKRVRSIMISAIRSLNAKCVKTLRILNRQTYEIV